MNIGTRLSLLCTLPLLLNACASGQQPQKDEQLLWKEKVEQRLDSLSTAMPVADNSGELAKMQARISLLEAENKREREDAQNQLADIGMQMAALRQEIRKLHSSLTKLKNQPKPKQPEQAKAKQPAPTPAIENKPEAEPAVETPPEKTDMAKPVNQRQEERAKRAYYDAYFALKNGDYFEASLAFRNFLRDFPDTKLAGEARYWHGESLLAQGDAASAMQIFQDIIREKPDTARHAAAMLKAGIIHEEQKDMEKAVSTYNQLIRQHPASSEAETARSRLKRRNG